MNREELRMHFLNGSDWVDNDQTADLLEVGEPLKEVKKVGTGWSACVGNLEAAAKDGCDLFISHEPSFCEFWDPKSPFRESIWGKKRVAFLEENNMGLLALHDTWDFWPIYGIQDSWAKCLGFESDTYVHDDYYRQQLRPDLISACKGLRLYEFEEKTLGEFAHEVKENIKDYNEKGFNVVGDLNKKVSSVSIGVGCIIPTFEMVEQGADVIIVNYDRAFESVTRIPLSDIGASFITLEHSTTEKVGMKGMCDYLNLTFPEIEAHFYCNEPQGNYIV